MVRSFKIFSHMVLVLGLVVFSLKPSMTNHVDANLVHPHHVAFSRFASIQKRMPTSPGGASFRFSFSKNEEKKILNVAVVPTFDAENLIYHAPRLTWVAPAASPASAFRPSVTVVLRI